MSAYRLVIAVLLLFVVSVSAKVCLLRTQGGPGYEEAVIFQKADEKAVEYYVDSFGMYLPRGEFARRAFAFAGGLRADTYWLKAAQYVSRHFGEPQVKLCFLDELYDAMLDADPYWYSAATVAARILDAVGRDHREAERLLRKAIARRPEQWQLWYELGGVYLFWPGREGDAARAYRTAAGLPDAPKLLLDVAATLYSEAGRHELARTITRERIQRYKERYGEDASIVRTAERDLQEFEARLFQQQLNRSVQDFLYRHGRLPKRLRELVQEGLVDEEATKEPYGQGWLMNPDTGEIASKGLGILEGHRMCGILLSWVHSYKSAKGSLPASLVEAVAFQRRRTHGAEAKRLFGDPPVLKPHPLLGKWDYDPETGEIELPDGYRYQDLYPEDGVSDGERPSEESASPAT